MSSSSWLKPMSREKTLTLTSQCFYRQISSVKMFLYIYFNLLWQVALFTVNIIHPFNSIFYTQHFCHIKNANQDTMITRILSFQSQDKDISQVWPLCTASAGGHHSCSATSLSTCLGAQTKSQTYPHCQRGKTAEHRLSLLLWHFVLSVLSWCRM